MRIEIKAPCDQDGFVLLQCHLCGEYFKLKGEEVNSKEIYEIWCPYCGLISNSYSTKETNEIAIKMATNYMMEEIYNNFKNLEKQTKNNNGFSFKAGKRPKEIFIKPIQVKIDNLEKQNYRCCKKDVKINPLYKNIGSYCPFCGGRYE